MKRYSIGCVAIPIIMCAAAIVGRPASAEGLDAADGRSERDLRMERFLRMAEIVKIEDVGEGITSPKRLTMRLDGIEHRAIFKTIDVMNRGIVRTSRLETCFRDSYHFEAAAYRLDRMMGIGLVPVTIVREVNGVEGSVQEWIEDVSSLRKALNAGHDRANCNVELLRRRLTKMYLFDSLIYNIDRNYDNILVNPQSEGFYLIDHSRAFRTNGAVQPPAEGQGVDHLDTDLAEHLRALEKQALMAALEEHLSKSQIKAIIKRRNKLVDILVEEGYLDPAA